MPERVAATNGSPAPREHGCDARNLVVSRRRPSSNLSRTAMLPFDPVTTTPRRLVSRCEEKPLTRLPKPGRPIPVNYSSLFNRPQQAAARSCRTRLRRSVYCSNAIRSAGAIEPWVGRTQAVGHRVIPLDRINSATASRSSLIKSFMFHTRAAGSVSQSLWLSLEVSPKILVKTETLDGLCAGFRRALLPFC